MSFGNLFLEYKEEFYSDLEKLISIESVSGEKQSECEKALDFILKRAEDFGLETKNVDNIAGHASLGKGKNLCATLTHLDVVPSGNNWTTMPFDLTFRDGRIYGRGVADDKGSALVTLYCLRILKEKGIEGKNEIRAIFGTTEEIGMTDMKHYFKSEKMPDYSFTPDSEYGICKSEKGILQLEIYADRHDGTFLNELHSGKAVNAVPDTAYALIDCSENDDHQLYRLADAKDGKFEFHYTIDGMMIISHGKSGHACEPEKAKNAVTSLIDLLASNFGYSDLGSLCSFIATHIRTETNGTSLGIKMRDASSGPLSVNVGTVHIGEQGATMTMDIRYPVTVNGDRILDRVRKAALSENLNVKVLSHLKPLNIDENAPIIKVLSSAYEEITGEKCDTYSTGGGTYARKLQNKGVAFGPVFKGDKCNMHSADESLDEENFLKHAQICLEAMYKMYKEDFGE
ncbi:MAG: Sapep family Mn(2+)-dependent dipeptidase [Acutalibacteraceae bacterium]